MPISWNGNFTMETISGIQLDGKQFFYVNPLEVNPGTSGTIFGYKHVLPTRPAGMHVHAVRRTWYVL